MICIYSCLVWVFIECKVTDHFLLQEICHQKDYIPISPKKLWLACMLVCRIFAWFATKRTLLCYDVWVEKCYWTTLEALFDYFQAVVCDRKAFRCFDYYTYKFTILTLFPHTWMLISLHGQWRRNKENY